MLAFALRTRAGVDYKAARGQLGGFTKLLQSRMGRSDWPVAVEQRGGLLHYSDNGSFTATWRR